MPYIARKTFSSIFLTGHFILLSAQSDRLERIGAVLIGPETVDVFHNIQTEYYLEKYQILSRNISIEKEDDSADIRFLEKKLLETLIPKMRWKS